MRDAIVSLMSIRRQLTVIVFLSAAVITPAFAASPSGDFPCQLSPQESLLDRGQRFLLETLKFTPVEATQAGYPGDATSPLDTQLDDASPATIAAERALYVAGKACFAITKAADPEDAADLTLLRDSINFSLFQLDTLQPSRYRPQDYVEMIGSGLFFPLTSTKGTEQERLTAVIARMEQVPRILDEARENLRPTDPIFIDTALDENDGDTGVIQQIGAMIPAASPLRSPFDAASKAAVTALDSYAAWLKSDL